MPQNPERAFLRGAASLKQGIERRRKRANFIRPRIHHITHHKNTDHAMALQRDIRGNIAKLRTQHLLHGALHFAQRASAHQHRPGLGKIDAPFSIHRALDALRNTAPNINRQSIARAHHVVRPSGQIHRDRIGKFFGAAESIGAEPLCLHRTGRSLLIQIVKRRNVRIWIRPRIKRRRVKRTGHISFVAPPAIAAILPLTLVATRSAAHGLVEFTHRIPSLQVGKPPGILGRKLWQQSIAVKAARNGWSSRRAACQSAAGLRQHRLACTRARLGQAGARRRQRRCPRVIRLASRCIACILAASAPPVRLTIVFASARRLLLRLRLEEPVFFFQFRARN